MTKWYLLFGMEWSYLVSQKKFVGMFPNLGNLYGVITKFYLYKKKKIQNKKNY